MLQALRVDEDIDDDVALVATTSGTTGTPKGALLTAAALTASAAATHDRLGGPGRWLLALPSYHIAGIQVLVRSLVAGNTPVELNVSAGSTSANCLLRWTNSGPVGAIRRWSPRSSPKRSTIPAPPKHSPNSSGADRRRPGPPTGPRRRGSAGVSVVRTYGMSETAGGCVYDGVPLDGVKLRIDDGRICSAARHWPRAIAIRPTPTRSPKPAGFAPTTLASLTIQECSACWAASTTRSAPAG